MKKTSAALLLIAYLAFITSVFVNTHHELHVYVCDKAAGNLLLNASSETDENCCSYTLMSEKLKLSTQHATPFYKLTVPGPFVLKSLNLVSIMQQNRSEVYTAYSTPLIYPHIYLTNRVLLI